MSAERPPADRASQSPEEYRAASGTGDPDRDRPEGGPVEVEDDAD